MVNAQIVAPPATILVHRISVGRKGVRPIERADGTVVAVNVAPRLDVPRRDANRLTVLPDRRANWYPQQADLVPRRDRVEHGELAVAEADLIPGREWRHGHRDVVLGGEAYDGGRRGHGPTRTAKGRCVLARRSTGDDMARTLLGHDRSSRFPDGRAGNGCRLGLTTPR